MLNYIGPWDGAPRDGVAGPTKTDGCALALSGGGFRATLFHLGVVERMYLLGALDRISYLTSVSGGSILAAKLALAWDALMDPVVTDRAAHFDVVVRQPILKLAKLNLRDRALHRAFLQLPWRRPIECLAELLDEHLYGGATFDKLTDRLPVGFNACDLSTGKRFVFHKDCFGGIQGFTTTACAALPVATAVAASAAFPVGFAPFVVNLRGPYRKWAGDKWGEPEVRDEEIPFGDGGIFENLALHAALHRRSDVFLSNCGEAVDFDVPFNQASAMATALRAILILMGRNARVGIDDFIQAEKRGEYNGVIVENTQWPAHLAAAGAHGFEQNEALMLARLRTDLDDFSDVEIEALRYHGASLADVNLRQRRPALIDPDRDRNVLRVGPPPTIDWTEIERGSHHRFGDLFLKFWRT